MVSLALLLLAALTLPPAGRGRPQLRGDFWPAGLHFDQTAGEVLKLHGAPTHTSRQVVAHRSVEQWHYGPPRAWRLTFVSFRGQRPRLQSVRLTHRAPPAP